jgi:diguanylate cyclase (GGDEF)-like protein
MNPPSSSFSHSVLDQGAQAAAALSPQARRERRHRERLRMVGLVFASYTVDGLLLLALALLGTVALPVPLAYLLAGTASCGLFLLVLRGALGEVWRDQYLLAPQMLLTTAINIGFMLWAPQVGLLLLMVLFTIFGFGALRMSTGWVMSGCLGIAGMVGAVVMLLGDRLALPMSTWQERVVSGVWFALLLARIALLGYVSARYRRALAQRNQELAATFEKLARLANRDELTGALNRRSIMRLLEEEHQRMQRTGVPFSIALVDMDHFKLINDTLGHAVGDDVLRGFTVRAAGEMRTTDRLGRYGGEEFLLVFTSTQDEPSAVAAAERVRAGVAAFDWTPLVPPSMKVTVSAGVALCRAGESVTQLLARADAALYTAKRDGRNRVRKG